MTRDFLWLQLTLRWWGFLCTLKRHPANCAGPPPIWMHGRNYVFGQPALEKSHPSGCTGAIMRPVLRCYQGPPSVEDGNGNSLNRPTGWHTVGVHGTAIYTEVWCIPHLSAPLRNTAFILDLGSARACWRGCTWRRRYVRACGWVTGY